MAATTAASAIAATAAIAAYLDAKLHIGADVRGGVLDDTSGDSLQFIQSRVAAERQLIYHDIEHWAKENRPNHLFLEYAGRSWTYKAFYEDLQKVGNWLMKDLGIKRHEMVAINGANSAEYLMLWFALDGIGGCQSFINSHISENALTHAIKLCECRYVLVEKSMVKDVEPCRGELAQAGVEIVYYDEQLFASFKDTTPIPKARTTGFTAQDLRSLLYTSGTTGLPKGVIYSTGRRINVARSTANQLRLRSTDKFYTCLPLYHAAAQALCTLPVIFAGASMRLGRKFSHSTFWPEVSGSRATHLQYVGELCRYLVNASVHPLEQKHCVRMAFGNGMRPDVWETFRQRFNIPVIHELYASSDGINATFNWNRGDFTRNAIALRGKIWHWKRGHTEVRVRIDPDTEDIVRGDDGWVQACFVNEPGEVIHKVDPEMASQVFKGYFKNDAASKKRWMTDVFEAGDLWFRSGDVMRQDADGRVFFVDRLGDTFRWKSENVSTNEVADVLGTFPQLAEVNVYGVAVPNADGRCGCATVVLRDDVTLATLDREALVRHVQANLPRYAVPIFLRVSPALPYTGTFKIQKGQAKREGVDPGLIAQSGSKDDLLWLPPNATSYQPYQRDDWEALKAGKVKL